jgi:hypothetical protein
MAAIFMAFPCECGGICDDTAFPVRNQNGKGLRQFGGLQAVKSIFQFNVMTSPTAISHGGATGRENG